MTPPATEPACGWVIRCTWKIDDPEMVHPQHSYQTKPTRKLAESAAWNVSLAGHQGLTLAEIHLRQGPDGPWERLSLPEMNDTGTPRRGQQ